MKIKVPRAAADDGTGYFKAELDVIKIV